MNWMSYLLKCWKSNLTGHLDIKPTTIQNQMNTTLWTALQVSYTMNHGLTVWIFPVQCSCTKRNVPRSSGQPMMTRTPKAQRPRFPPLDLTKQLFQCVSGSSDSESYSSAVRDRPEDKRRSLRRHMLLQTVN